MCWTVWPEFIAVLIMESERTAVFAPVAVNLSVMPRTDWQNALSEAENRTVRHAGYIVTVRI